METIRGYLLKQRKGLSHWDALLEEWLFAIERFCRITGGEDAPYWYNERSNIGILSGAAWRCGRIALEEFQYVKGFKNKPKWLGRADLWLSSDDSDELIEAKFKWISLCSKNGIGPYVQDVIESSVKDVRKSNGMDESDKCIGVAFCPLYASKKNMNEIDALIDRAIKELSTLDYHAIAWSFPKETRKEVSEKGNILPGVIMAVKNAQYD